MYPPPGTHHGPTLWAGTNSGSVYAYALEVPGVGSGPGRGGEPGSGSGGGGGGGGGAGSSVEALLGKEIQLMHRAPVVWICVLDGRGRPLPEPYEASRDLAAAPDMSTAHSVLIASEEQLKVRRGGSWGGGFPPSLWMSWVGGGLGFSVTIFL